VLLALLIIAASPEETRVKGNQVALASLGVWGLASAVAGSVGLATTHDPQWQGVHGANLVWGAVNLVIGVVGLAMGLKDAEPKPPAPSLYIANAALDVGYLAVSAGVWQNVKDAPVIGFTQASMVQALALLLFDTTMALFHQGFFEAQR